MPEMSVIIIGMEILIIGLFVSTFLKGFNRRMGQLIKTIPYIITLITLGVWLIYGFTHLEHIGELKFLETRIV